MNTKPKLKCFERHKLVNRAVTHKHTKAKRVREIEGILGRWGLESDRTETESCRQGWKNRKERKGRQLTGGRDGWEIRAAANMIETRCVDP